MARLPIEKQITFLFTHDLGATAKFYEYTLGMKLMLDQGQCRIYEVTSNGWIGFCQREDVASIKDNVIFTIVTPEVERWYEQLNALGVKFEKRPTTNEKFNIFHCLFRDPNGYLIEIQQFL